MGTALSSVPPLPWRLLVPGCWVGAVVSGRNGSFLGGFGHSGFVEGDGQPPRLGPWRFPGCCRSPALREGGEPGPGGCWPSASAGTQGLAAAPFKPVPAFGPRYRALPCPGVLGRWARRFGPELGEAALRGAAGGWRGVGSGGARRGGF